MLRGIFPITKKYKSSNDMEVQMLEILNAVQEGAKSPTQAQSELLLLYSVMASATPLLEHLEYKDDTVAQGEWLHKYTKKRYYSTELTGKYGYSADDVIKHLP